MSRKAIAKKTRFEVFKRDSFTCQYCGKGAPDVVLHVDHIEPVSKGGTNEIINLVTSCFDCNLGKSDRQLSDKAVISKQIDQLKQLNERKEQLEMMAKWRAGMVSIEAVAADQVLGEINRILLRTPYRAGENYKAEIFKMVRKYGLPEIFEAIDKSDNQYLAGNSDQGSVNKFLDYIPRICYWQKLHREDPVEKEISHAIAIAMKKGFRVSRHEFYRDIKSYLDANCDLEDVKQAIYSTTGITKFREWMQEFMEVSNG